MFFAIVILLSFIVLALAAARWGQDSRDTLSTTREHRNKRHAII